MYDIACSLQRHLQVQLIKISNMKTHELFFTCLISFFFILVFFCFQKENKDLQANFKFVVPVFHSYAHNMACQVCSIKIYWIKVHCWLNLISQHTVLRILQSFTSNFEIKFKNKNYMCMFFLYTLHSIVSERI